MNTVYDVAVVGMGAMGSAAAFQLARRGMRVLGVDRFTPPHTRGSSHGRSRIIREAYYEHPLYVPLVQRAYTLWAELERECGEALLLRTGGVMVGAESGSLIQGVLRSADEHGIAHEVLTASALHRRFPALTPLDHMVGVLETRAGVLFPEQILAAHLARAELHGATLRLNEAVLGWDRGGAGVVLRTTNGTYEARQVILAVGAWTGVLAQELALPLSVERQVIHWFQPALFPEHHIPQHMPVSIWQLDDGTLFYTTPDTGDGVKIGVHHNGHITTAETVDRGITSSEVAFVYDLLRRFLPFAKGHPTDSAVCLYTNTPDHHFLIDRHPALPEMLMVSACSGHGFKFASVVGEIAADLVTSGVSRFDLAPFSLARFGGAEATAR